MLAWYDLVSSLHVLHAGGFWATELWTLARLWQENTAQANSSTLCNLPSRTPSFVPAPGVRIHQEEDPIALRQHSGTTLRHAKRETEKRDAWTQTDPDKRTHPTNDGHELAPLAVRTYLWNIAAQAGTVHQQVRRDGLPMLKLRSLVVSTSAMIFGCRCWNLEKLAHINSIPGQDVQIKKKHLQGSITCMQAYVGFMLGMCRHEKNKTAPRSEVCNWLLDCECACLGENRLRPSGPDQQKKLPRSGFWSGPMKARKRCPKWENDLKTYFWHSPILQPFLMFSR